MISDPKLGKTFLLILVLLATSVTAAQEKPPRDLIKRSANARLAAVQGQTFEQIMNRIQKLDVTDPEQMRMLGMLTITAQEKQIVDTHIKRTLFQSCREKLRKVLTTPKHFALPGEERISVVHKSMSNAISCIQKACDGLLMTDDGLAVTRKFAVALWFDAPLTRTDAPSLDDDAGITMHERRHTVSGVKKFTCSGIDPLMNLLMDASVDIKSDDGNCTLNIVPWMTGIQVTRYTAHDNRTWTAESMLGQGVHVEAVQRILDYPHTPETHGPEHLEMTPRQERAGKLALMRKLCALDSDNPVALCAGPAFKRLLLTQATEAEVKPLLAITGPDSLAMIEEITKTRSLCKAGTAPSEYPVLTVDLEDKRQHTVLNSSLSEKFTVSRARSNLLKN